MDTKLNDRELLEAALIAQTTVPFAYGDVGFETVFDRERDRYLVMLVGFDEGRRVHGCLVHVDLVDGMFLVQRDGIEYGIARELHDRGVPLDRIVMAYRSPNEPPLSARLVA